MEDTTDLELEAQGGPVQRPQPGKGKISQKSAKMIWIVCIAICLAAVGLVVADLGFDLFKRRGAAGNAPEDNQPAPVKKGNRPVSEKRKLAGEFALRTDKAKKSMEGSRAYDFVRVAIKKARQASDSADKERADGDLWKSAWLSYYEARYALELFRFSWQFDRGKVPMVNEPDDIALIEQLEEAELNSEEAPTHLAASYLYDRMDEEIRKLERKMDPVAKAQSVKTENEEVKTARKKWEAARDKQEKESFTQADLDYVKRPARGADEPAPYLD